MRIGIDIDDTIVDTWRYMKPLFCQLYGVSYHDLVRARYPYYQAVKDKVSEDEFFAKIKKYYTAYSCEIPMIKGANKYIKKLHDMGHEIIFITARSDRGYDDPLKSAKEILDKYGIYYDKILVGWNDKSIPCKEELIDIFIDDSEKHCKEVSDVGVKTIMFSRYYNRYNKEHKRIRTWFGIYRYIKKCK